MNTGTLRDWLEVVGLFGVIGSLVFVGLQMMQDREIALSAIYQERASAVNAFETTLATDAVIRGAMVKLAEGGMETLTADEQMALGQVLRAGRTLMDNSHYQWQQGFAPDGHWQQIRGMIRVRLADPGSRDLMLQEPLRPAFRDVLLEIDAEVQAQRAGTAAP
ncbi:MAG TPA: hypothetical protein VLA56_02850 [Pseudomonadales bacterium]|nr:hypothetical protein [Pseudomonadales bacterium]